MGSSSSVESYPAVINKGGETNLDLPAGRSTDVELLEPVISMLVDEAIQKMNKGEEQFMLGVAEFEGLFELFPDLHRVIFVHSHLALQCLKSAIDNPQYSPQARQKLLVLKDKLNYYYQRFVYNAYSNNDLIKFI